MMPKWDHLNMKIQRGFATSWVNGEFSLANNRRHTVGARIFALGVLNNIPQDLEAKSIVSLYGKKRAVPADIGRCQDQVELIFVGNPVCSRGLLLYSVGSTNTLAKVSEMWFFS
jgi:hypothetical protein